jgi:hypothetical protein
MDTCNLAIRMKRQGDFKFKASMGYVARDCVSKKQVEKKRKGKLQSKMYCMILCSNYMTSILVRVYALMMEKSICKSIYNNMLIVVLSR